MTNLVGDLFEQLDFPVKKIAKGAAATLLGMAVVMPITFRHGLIAYAQHVAAHYEQTIVTPMLARLPRPLPAPPGQTGDQAP